MNPSPTTQERPINDHPNRTATRRAGTPAVSQATLSAYVTDWPLYYPLPHSVAISVAPVAVATPAGEVADRSRAWALRKAREAAALGIVDDLADLPDWEYGDGWSDES